MRAAGLGAGTGKALATEGLRADHRADLVPVYIDVADAHEAAHFGRGLLDAGVNPKREPEARGIERRTNIADPVARETDNMQHRSEHLALQRLDRREFIGHRRDERALGAVSRQRKIENGPGFRGHTGLVGLQCRACILIDHRADIGRVIHRIANFQFGHGTLQHGDDAVRHVLLHEEKPRGGATLTRAVKGRGQNVAHGLFRKR